jgi:hypothetical protein
MNKGSTKISVRVGDDLLSEIREQVELLNDRPGASREWTVTEYVIQSVISKLRHTQRSRGQQGTYSLEKVDEWGPREWVGDEG